MLIGIPKESAQGETRVAATPKTVVQLIKLGFDVCIETGAGQAASFPDQAYIEAGAKCVDITQVWQSDLVLKINPPQLNEQGDFEAKNMPENSSLVSFINPQQNTQILNKLTEQKINVMAMDAVPRISRAQSLDALSSMANIAGYRAVVEAANHFGRFFTGQITAAGKVPPAKVLVIGAGVAGLAAIGAAGSLGAIVRAFDVRPEVKEQVESMGASFLEVDITEQQDNRDGYAKETSQAFNDAAAKLYAQQAKEVDIIITTALIPNRPAPKLISKDIIDQMQSGSVIVDLAAANGGNCDYTQADKVITTDNGVTIIGYTDLASRLPAQASQLYSTNLVNLLKLLCKNKDGQIDIDFNDPVIRALTVSKAGEMTYPPPALSVSATPASKPAPKADPALVEKPKPNPWKKYSLWGAGLAAFAWLGHIAPAEFMSHLTVFVLACIVGYYVVWNVPHALHTPLMSVTNAISGIIVVGALLQIGQGSLFMSALAFIAVLVASINIFGGFAVTRRMLKMFHKAD